MKNNKYFISLPYIYPVCPLNFNHARMFVVADIIARYFRYKGKDVYFPIASHYSGNTAQKLSEVFKQIYSLNKVQLRPLEEKVLNLFKKIYKTPAYILPSFTNPINILDFYSQEILWELKSLNVSCNYEHYYTTGFKDFANFVKTIISLYEKNKLLIHKQNGELVLDYDNDSWKFKMLNLLNSAEFIQAFHKNNVSSAVKNVRNDWNFVRKKGYGVTYKNKGVIDPMFDSELFTIFDLYIRFKRIYSHTTVDYNNFFNILFKVLADEEVSNDILIKEIISWLPCDLFIAEEHLKNWIIKRLYTESLLINQKYQTKKYFILGMGLLDGKRMSASQGHAILAKDLIDQYGSVKARLIIILAGGHPSKTYNYDKSLPTQADKLLNNFINYFTYLLSMRNKSIHPNRPVEEGLITSICGTIEKNIQEGYFQQAIMELLSILPRKYRFPDSRIVKPLLSIFNKYTGILLPGLLDNFWQNTSEMKQL